MNTNKKIQIAHIIPKMNYGGVETAIQKSHKELNALFDYRIFTAKNKGEINIGQQGIITFLLNILFKRYNPDLVITSLWWSHPFGLLLKLFGYKWVSFFHSAASTHYINKYITLIAAKYSDACLVDSSETEKFIYKMTNKKIYIIPFIFSNSKKIQINKRENDFIFVGRNIKDKRLDLLIKFIKEISKLIINVKFILIINGPVNSETNEIKRLSIKILKNLDNNKVLHYLEKTNFYLHFSDREGMSMSTIEAIQAGCVPVIRLSGELKNYLNNKSAFIINGESDSDIVEIATRIHNAYNDTKSLNMIRRINLEKIKNLNNYTQSFKKIILQELGL